MLAAGWSGLGPIRRVLGRELWGMELAKSPVCLNVLRCGRRKGV
jgi:hypothetical protein